MNHSSRSARASAEAERLREVFAGAALDVTPSAVPLGAIERAGRSRLRRRRAAVLGVACGALLVPFAVAGLRDGTEPAPGTSVRPSPTRSASPTPTPAATAPEAPPVRTVAPGERVRVAPGIRIWLTPQGKHWSEPEQPDQFRSVVDGNLDMAAPGLTMQSSGKSGGQWFLSGIFHGPGTPARAEITTTGGPVTATVLTLPGNPGWGVWYAVTKLPPLAKGHVDPMDGITKVTVYDADDREIASLVTGAG
ncbi:hypothetical protein AB0912_28930 [Streptomyces sp. NPDC007084]|uniref:hypothetical protein n=1 Tax=Streptomyces sp. NPDC007084 TaxID=3154313 RepID=UPI003454852C